MRNYCMTVGAALVAACVLLSCAGMCSAAAKKASTSKSKKSSGSAVSFESPVPIDTQNIPVNYLAEDISLRVRVVNRLGEYTAGARSDVGFNLGGGQKNYAVRYYIDEPLLAAAQAIFQRSFKVVDEEQGKDAPVVELAVTNFSGDTFLDGRPDNDRDWVLYNTMGLTVELRLLDAGGTVIVDFSSPQSVATQTPFAQVRNTNWSLQGPAVGKMAGQALSDLIPRFFADAAVRKGLRYAGSAAAQTQDLAAKAEEAEGKGDLRTAFTLYMQALAQGPLDYDLVARIIALAKGMNPVPAIDEEARKHAAYGKAALDLAKDKAGYFNAIEEYQKAIRLAPWWLDLYVNTALIMEKAGLYADAAEYLKLYLLAAPQAADAEKIKTKMYELEYKVQQGEKESKKDKGPVTIYINQ